MCGDVAAWLGPGSKTHTHEYAAQQKMLARFDSLETNLMARMDQLLAR
jgi:hypothetical protein